MKNIFFLLGFLPMISFAQIGGSIALDKRKVVSAIEFSIIGNQTGKFVFDIAVNADGHVTSCVVIKVESTLVSTPLMMKAKNLIVNNLKFERAPGFPEHHEGTVTITVFKE